MKRFVLYTLFWTYGRTTRQYDVLCGLILCFIFLTPPIMFNDSSRLQKKDRSSVEISTQKTDKLEMNAEAEKKTP